jgi:hypothetical protein
VEGLIATALFAASVATLFAWAIRFKTVIRVSSLDVLSSRHRHGPICGCDKCTECDRVIKELK